MRIALFEDQKSAGLTPLALARPVFELLCGQFTLRDRLVRTLEAGEWGAFLRPYLAETYREEHPEAHTNEFNWLAAGPTLLVNGRWLGDPHELEQADLDTVGVQGDVIAWLLLDPLESALLTSDNWDDALWQIARTRHRVPAGGTFLRHPWDLVNANPERLTADFRLRPRPRMTHGFGPQVAVVGDPADVFIDPAATVDPFVVLDASQGPIQIGARARVQAFTRIEGPCFIGQETQLFRANVRAGTSIGPLCRIGGEIEASILHGCVNKYHDGFLGHSYVCPWVNLGAETTNSDLKNDYSDVRVPINGESVDAGTRKVGCFLGDHTKTGLGSLFNTGTAVGVMCLILPGGELLPKHIPSFSRIWHGELTEGLPLESLLETARAAMERRNQDFTPAQERLYRILHTRTKVEREKAIYRAAGKRSVPLSGRV